MNLKKYINFNMQKNKISLNKYLFNQDNPSAPDLEQAVLGIIIEDRVALNIVLSKLVADDFYEADHKKIFEVISNMYEKSIPVDLLTLTEAIKQTGITQFSNGDNVPYYLAHIANTASNTTSLERHIAIILEKSLLRMQIRSACENLEKCYAANADPFENDSTLQKELLQRTGKIMSKKTQTTSEILNKIFQDFNTPSKGNITGVPSGLLNLDNITAGFQDTDLIILAARPSMGKSGLALSMCINIAKFGFPVCIFSLEMSASQLVQRALSIESEVPLENIRANNLTENQKDIISQCRPILENIPLHLNDNSSMNIIQIRAELYKLKMLHDIKICFIDYLGLINFTEDTKGKSTNDQIGDISKQLKQIAKELNIPIIALAQLSRSVETRGGDKRPILSDLRDSGNIEQDADLVLFLYRAEYYGIEKYADGSSTQGVAEIIIAKHRNGKLGTAMSRFIALLTKFCDEYIPKTFKRINIHNAANEDKDDLPF